MSLTLSFIIGTITLITAICFPLFQKRKLPKGFPPGPTSLPLIGNWHQIILVTHEKLAQLGKKYDGIFTIDYGTYRCIILDDLKLIKQCFNDPVFSGRPKSRVLLDRQGTTLKYSRGIVFSDGNFWAEQRRFVVKHLREFGLGKIFMEEIMHEEIQELIEGLRSRVGQAIDTRGLFSAGIVNTLWRISAGSRTPQNDPELQAILAAVTGFVSTHRILQQLALAFPTLSDVFPNLSGLTRIRHHNTLITKYVKAEYNAHKMSLTPGKPRDLMDAMIDQISITSNPASSFYKDEGEACVIKSVEDILNGVSDTPAKALQWMFLFMALYPEIQEKMADEILKAVGPSGQPKLIDRPNMPFTECVIMEVLRYVPAFPLGVKHRTQAEVNIRGYVIPKDTAVLANLYAVLHDERIWGDPETFRPERFLLPDGTANKSHEAFIPFSVGKRVCIGEKLAKDQIFLFAASLFQHFRVTINPKKIKPSIKPTSAMVLAPEVHELILHERI